MIRFPAAALLLAGCVAPPAPAPGDPAEPTGFIRPAGSPASRHAGTVLSADPPLVRLADPGRDQVPGVALVAREADLRPAALLRAGERRGSVLAVTVVRGALRPGLEVVEPSAEAAAAAGRLDPAR